MNTKKILVKNILAGFYVITRENACIYINHLYIHPIYQGNKIGSSVLMSIKKHANENSLVLRVGALRGSKANNFYLSHGFIYTHEEEWDIYYEYNSAKSGNASGQALNFTIKQ